MTSDARFAVRVRRLVAVSLVALAVIWQLAVQTARPPTVVGAALVGGWLLMPTLLAASLRRPSMRYALLAPATLVSFALLAMCLVALPPLPAARAGWLLVTAGVLLGGTLGSWFWYRWLPVPRALDDPFSPGRWVGVSLHVGLMVAGLVLVGVSLLAPSS